MISRILNSRTKTITSAAFLLAVFSLLSRLLGVLRSRLLAGEFGAGKELDIYFAAFKIPDFVYGVLIVGGISVAFLPVFSEYFGKNRLNLLLEEWPEDATKFVNNLLNCFLFLLVSICLVLFLLAPFLIHILVPGFTEDKKIITINLTRIMFLSPIIFGLSSIFSGILQYFNKFLVYSLAPILYNIGIIIGILFFVPVFGIYGLGYGVVFGALLHLLIQIPSAMHSGYKYKFLLDFKDQSIRKVFKMMGPRIISVTADNINLIIITAIASTLAVGSISIFSLANDFLYFPVGIIGISFAISSFPVFSRYMANGQKKEFIEHFSVVFRQIIFLTVPVSFLMFLLRAQITRMAYGYGKFDWQDTRLTAAALGIFCFAVLANSLIPLVVRAFFSLQNTKTPALIGVSCVALNVFLSVSFVFLLKHNFSFYSFWSNLLKLQDIKNIEVVALPLALSLVSAFQLFLLLFWLYKRIGDFEIKRIISSFFKSLVASLLLAVSTYFGLFIFSFVVNMKTFAGIFIQTLFASLLGALFYLLASFLLKSEELKITAGSIARRFKH